MLRSSSFLFAALGFLAGCNETTRQAASSAAAPKIATVGWRLLSKNPPGAKTEAPPVGYIEGRRSREGAFYLVYDPAFTPVGHVTQGGTALKYSAIPYRGDESMGRGLMTEQFAAILGVPGPLYLYDMKGQPKDLPE